MAVFRCSNVGGGMRGVETLIGLTRSEDDRYTENTEKMLICSVFVPVLSTFLMTTATCPFSMELSSLTMRTRQVQRTNKDTAKRMRPTARSGNCTLAKMCLPVVIVPTSEDLDEGGHCGPNGSLMFQ
uniref:Uncharacterized protein n=1 Tax=Amphiprion percula TaxID=161767 RepID=A0A3P8TGJ3_AMPPE